MIRENSCYFNKEIFFKFLGNFLSEYQLSFKNEN